MSDELSLTPVGSEPGTVANPVAGASAESPPAGTSDDEPAKPLRPKTMHRDVTMHNLGGQPDSCTWLCKSYRAKRKMRRALSSMDTGMNSFVHMRIGQHGEPRVTKSFLTYSDSDDIYCNPQFGPQHANSFAMPRTKGDKGLLFVNVFHEGLRKPLFIAGCTITLPDLIEKLVDAGPGKFKKHRLQLFDQEIVPNAGDGDEGREAGTIELKLMWEPGTDADISPEDQGTLHVQVIAGHDLRDITGLQVSDINTFADTTTLQFTAGVLFLYVLSAALFYQLVHFNQSVDGESFLDNLVFVITTFSTVGYGNHSLLPPAWLSVHERLYTCVFIVLGMAVLGVLIGTVGDFAAATMHMAKHKSRELDISTHMGNDQAMLSKPTLQAQTEAALIAKHKDWNTRADIDPHILQREIGNRIVWHFVKQELTKVMFSALSLSAVLLLGTVVFYYTERNETYGVSYSECQEFMQMEEGTATGMEAVDRAVGVDKNNGCLVGQMCHRKEERGCVCSFEYAQSCYYNATTNETVTVLKSGMDNAAHIQCHVTGLHLIDALYFTVVTASTVGYGDVTPQSLVGKIFCLLYIPAAVAIMSKAIMILALIPSDYRRLKLEEYVLDQFGDELSAPDFTDLKVSVNLGPEDPIAKNDFILAMLMRLGKVQDYDMARIEHIFFKLDKDKNGVLERSDLSDLLQAQSSWVQELKKGGAMSAMDKRTT